MARPSAEVLIVAVVAALAVAQSTTAVEAASQRTAPRLLTPVARTLDRQASSSSSRASTPDCNGSLASCVDCTTLLTCTKLNNVYRPLPPTACPESTPYCLDGKCVATLPQGDTRCNSPPLATADFQCIGDGYFPSPSDCRKYYQCVDGQAYESDCSPYRNTVYGHARAMCVPNSEAQCSTASCTNANVGQYQLWSANHSVYFVCTDTSPAHAYVADCGADRQIDAATGDCVVACLREGRLPVAGNAAEYVECVQTGTGVFAGPIPRTCPGSSTFDAASERCGVATTAGSTVVEDYFEPRADVPESMYNIPADFRIGSASAAYQVEGAWNVSRKTPSIQDVYFHSRPELDNGDVACDSYHKWREDVDLIKSIGLQAYRFSIAWTRVLPEGDQAGGADPVGVQYYSDLIDELVANDIEPIVTVYHWDLPQKYQDDGGWLNPDMQERFVDYADFVFKTYGDRVKRWVLINEPHMSCLQGYELGTFGPGVAEPGTGAYLCGHNHILAYAMAYRLYDQTYRPTQNGLVGASLDTTFAQPATDSAADQEAAARSMKFELGWFADPLAFGDYPQVMKDIVGTNSRAAGLAASRLPSFTDAQKVLIKGAWDFLGLNHYSVMLVSPGTEPTTTPTFLNDTYITSSFPSNWLNEARPIFKVTPWGIRDTLNYIKSNYNNMPVLITENGYAGDRSEGLDDTGRIGYYSSYMRAVLRAINEDGCNVIGYTAWCLMDNLEWTNGYSLRFGLVHVDFDDPERNRTLKASASFFRNVIAQRYVPYVAPN